MIRQADPFADGKHGPDANRAPGPESGPQSAHWWQDFAWDRGILIKKTGIHLKVSWPVIAEIASWAMWLLILKAAALRARFRFPGRPSLWFAPERPRAWYLLGGVAIWAGVATAQKPDHATAAVFFDDTTAGAPPSLGVEPYLNARCTDISKSHVAQVFEEVFGYPLSVDSMRSVGEIIEKPEKNGVHGGRIVLAPYLPRPGFTYQRVIDTMDPNGCCRDLRTPTCGGEPVLVWIKTKTPEGRFSINNKAAVLAAPHEVYSPEELHSIRTFTDRMGLDWGGLDILRDRDGRIYVVDVNKTDLGPVIALSWRDKIVSMERLALALRGLLNRPS